MRRAKPMKQDSRQDLSFKLLANIFRNFSQENCGGNFMKNYSSYRLADRIENLHLVTIMIIVTCPQNLRRIGLLSADNSASAEISAAVFVVSITISESYV